MVLLIRLRLMEPVTHPHTAHLRLFYLFRCRTRLPLRESRVLAFAKPGCSAISLIDEGISSDLESNQEPLVTENHFQLQS